MYIIIHCMAYDNTLIHITCHKCICVCVRTNVSNESATFKGIHGSFHWLESQLLKCLLVQVNWLLQCFFIRFCCSALGCAVIFKTPTCLEKGPETGRLSHVLVAVGFISMFML